jgi:transposase
MRAHKTGLSDRGRSPSKIAGLHAVSHPTVQKWIDRFDEEGPEGLYDRERQGRPRELGNEAREEIEQLLGGAPTEEIRWGRAKTKLDGRPHASRSISTENSTSTSTKTLFAAH